jgi:hypothetical protein
MIGQSAAPPQPSAFPQFRLKNLFRRAEKSHVAHEPISRDRVSPAVETSRHYDAFVVIGLVAVIVGAATGSLPIALAVFAAPTLALGAALFVRSHL